MKRFIQLYDQMPRLLTRYWRYSLPLLGLLMVFPVTAHVKWFVEFDTYKPPRPILDIMQIPAFWALLFFSILVIFVAQTIDRKISPIAWITRLEQKCAPHMHDLLRVSIALFFALLANFYPHTFLTPELLTELQILPYLHLFIALFCIFSATAFIGALGIIMLFLLAVYEYGLYHLLDYPIFIGLAIFFIMDSFYKGKRSDLAFFILRILTCLSLFWGALEKFAHPHLFVALFQDYPYLDLGFDHAQDFVILSGAFIEFSAVYLILFGRTSAKACAAIVLLLFIVGIPPFGAVDAIGHFPFFFSILTMSLLPNIYELKAKAYWHIPIYLGTLLTVFILYYGSYRLIMAFY